MANAEQEAASVSGSVGDVEKSTTLILNTIFEKLSNHAAVKADTPPRLFFPNGVELVSAKVAVSPTAGISVEVQIAGEKGVKHNTLGSLAPRATPTIRSLVPSKVPIGWAGIVLISGSGFDAGSFALFDGDVPKLIHQTPAVIQVELTQSITARQGSKAVIVHTEDGNESNTLTFEVEKLSVE